MINCPVCGKRLSYKDWDGERGMEEYIEECTNPRCKGYIDHWAFGYQDFKIGRWESETFASHIYLTNKKDINFANKVEKEFALRIRYYKKRAKK